MQKKTDVKIYLGDVFKSIDSERKQVSQVETFKMNKSKLCHTDRDNFIVHVKSSLSRPWKRGLEKNWYIIILTTTLREHYPWGEKVIELMNSDLDGRIMNKFVALRTKIYSYITDEGHSGKKVKRQKDLCKKKPKKKTRN